MDLSKFNLLGTNFNGVRCSRWYGDKYFAVDFSESLMDNSNFINEGHKSLVTSACYSPDGKKIISASDDYTIKEWEVSTGICIKTYEEYPPKLIIQNCNLKNLHPNTNLKNEIIEKLKQYGAIF